MTTLLDMRTVFIDFSISNAICAIVMAFLWRQNHRRSPGLSFWLAFFIMQFLAVLLVTLRGMIPNFISIVVANTLGVGGIILLYMGMERFANKVRSQIHNYVLLVVFFFVHTYFTYVQPSLSARNQNYSLTAILLSIQIGWFTLYRIDTRRLKHASSVGLIFVLFGLVNLARLLLESALPQINDLFQSGFLDILVILIFQVLYIGLTFTLFLLVNHRLLAELERDVNERRHTEFSLQQRLMELETVNRLSISLRAGKNLEELLRILLKETLNLISTEAGCILLIDGKKHTLELAESHGWFVSKPEFSLSVSEGIVGRVLEANEPHISFDLQEDLLSSSPSRSISVGPASGVFLPLRGEKDTIGMLILSFHVSRVICKNELRLLTIISQLAANAITRSRLHDQVEAYNTNLQEEIDQKVLVQKLLSTEKELLSTTLMSIADGVIVTDENGLILLCNRAAEAITGYSVSEALYNPVNDVFKIHNSNSPEPAPDAIDYLLELDGEPTSKSHVEHRSPLIIAKTGQRILLSAQITPFRLVEVNAIGYVIVFQNINEKLKAEAQNVLSQKMEAIGQLAAGIAHEINTPIQYVGDNVKFLGKAYSKYTDALTAYRQVIVEHIEIPVRPDELDQLDEMARQKKISYYFNEIPKAIQESLDGIERVRKIVLAMREFSHPSEREKTFSDINHGIETTTVISRNEWKYCAEMELNLDEELPLVFCQIDEINQVVLNMIVNASQAIQEKLPSGSEQKGKISIRTRKQEDKVLVTIQDTGNGIPLEIRARIFDPFFTTKGIGKGTGQGLSMAHNIIVNKHCGRISIDSEPGQGTTFTIELPVNSSELEQ
jgi:PAS domain S-box-containing protein